MRLRIPLQSAFVVDFSFVGQFTKLISSCYTEGDSKYVGTVVVNVVPYLSMFFPGKKSYTHGIS